MYLYPKPVDFLKSIDGLTSLVEFYNTDVLFDPVFFVFSIRSRRYQGPSATLM